MTDEFDYETARHRPTDSTNPDSGAKLVAQQELADAYRLMQENHPKMTFSEFAAGAHDIVFGFLFNKKRQPSL